MSWNAKVIKQRFPVYVSNFLDPFPPFSAASLDLTSPDTNLRGMGGFAPFSSKMYMSGALSNIAMAVNDTAYTVAAGFLTDELLAAKDGADTIKVTRNDLETVLATSSQIAHYSAKALETVPDVRAAFETRSIAAGLESSNIYSLEAAAGAACSGRL